MKEGSDESVAFASAYARILHYVSSLVRDSAEAEDLTQETFLRAYRGHDALREPQATLAWLYRIATHVCVDRIRQRARRPIEADPAVEEIDLADLGPPLQQVIEQSDMSACVQAYLVGLPDGYRAVLLLHDLHELTGPQIAELLGLTLATVKIRLHRARRRCSVIGQASLSKNEKVSLYCRCRPETGR